MEFFVFKSCKGDILIAGGVAPGVKGAVNLRRTNVHDRNKKHTCTGRYCSLQVLSPSGESMIVSSMKECDTPEKRNDFKTGGATPRLFIFGPYKAISTLNSH